MLTFRVLVASLGLCVVGPALHTQGTPAYTVVVNGSNTVSSLTRAELSKLFLKKLTAWRDGRLVLPIDQTAGSTVRQGFSRTIHRKQVSAVKGYWQKMIFSGRGVPPPEIQSDAEVLVYVRSHPNAIGYVSVGTTLGADVRMVRVSDIE